MLRWDGVVRLVPGCGLQLVWGVQQLGHEVGQSNALGAEVRNGWTSLLMPYLTLHIEARMYELSLPSAAGYAIILIAVFFSLNSMCLYSLIL